MTVAIFPVRGQPPHIGHVLSLMGLYPLYDEIIVAVTSNTYGGRKPQIIPPSESVRILEDVFKYLPKYRVIFVDKGFSQRDRFDDLPHFDVVVGGDPGIERNMERLGIEHAHVPRSTICGMDISGTILRGVLSEED